MRLPRIKGIIDRRMLINYRVDAGVAAQQLPAPFRPKLVDGYAVAGICLIRLKAMRPAAMPAWLGVGSENAAHRFAVEWDDDGETREGVFIPRRDSSSRMNAMLGGRLVPGEHHRARFDVSETDERLQIAVASDDGKTRVRVDASIAATIAATSIFGSLDDASRFFERGSLGYSATRDCGRFDGLELRCDRWSVQPLAVEAVESSYFDDATRFPPGSITFDNALLMRDVHHQWNSQDDLCCAADA